MDARVLVFGSDPGDRYRAGRTVRALRQAGLAADDVCDCTAAWLGEMLATSTRPVWLVRAGAWPVRPGRKVFPPPSATGLPLAALGMVRAEDGAKASGVFLEVGDKAAQEWSSLYTQTGGDFSCTGKLSTRLPPVASLYLEPGPATSLAERLARGEELNEAVRAELGGHAIRVVHFAPLDVHYDAGLRVVQLVTSLQQGGAERVALDLATELGSHGARCRIVTLGNPTRAAFAAPADAVDLARLCRDQQARAEAVARAVHARVCRRHCACSPD